MPTVRLSPDWRSDLVGLGVCWMWVNCGAVSLSLSAGTDQIKDLDVFMTRSLPKHWWAATEHLHPSPLFLFTFKDKRRMTSFELMNCQVALFCHCWSSSSSSISNSCLSSDHNGRKVHFSGKLRLVKTHWAAATPQSHAVCMYPSCLASPFLTLMWANEIFRLSSTGIIVHLQSLAIV